MSFQLEIVRFVIIGDLRDSRAQIGLLLQVFIDVDAFDALDDQSHGAVRRAQHAVDDGSGADPIDLFGVRLLDIGSLGRSQANNPLVCDIDKGVIHQPDRSLLAYCERQPHHRINHHPAERQNRQLGRNCNVVLFGNTHIIHLRSAHQLRSARARVAPWLSAG